MAETIERMAAESAARLALPTVVQSIPRSGAREVDPKLAEIRIVFSKPMLDGTWSWVAAKEAFPRMRGPSHFLPDGKTCVLPVTLEPGKTYELWANSENSHNFRDADGRPATPYYLRFQTRK